MKKTFLLCSVLFLFVVSSAIADPSFEATGLVRTVSLYENYLPVLGRFDTQTLSLYTLYSFRAGAEFLTELTMDLNGDVPDDVYTDYYMELQLIKPVGKGFSVRIKDVQGTYMGRVVRFGVGYDF